MSLSGKTLTSQALSYPSIYSDGNPDSGLEAPAMPQYFPTIPLQLSQPLPLHRGFKAYFLNNHPVLYTKLRTFSTTHTHPSLSSHPVSAIYPWPLDAILAPKRKPNETPLDRIYVMYHYLIRGDYNVLRNEVQDFFDHHNWHVHSIPDPRDHDPERYAVLAAITQYLAHGINRRIMVSRRYRRDPRGRWRTAAYGCFRGTRGYLPVFEQLDREPGWARRVKMVEGGLEICQAWASGVWGERCSARFAAKEIVSTEIVECFI